MAARLMYLRPPTRMRSGDVARVVGSAAVAAVALSGCGTGFLSGAPVTVTAPAPVTVTAQPQGNGAAPAVTVTAEPAPAPATPTVTVTRTLEPPAAHNREYGVSTEEGNWKDCGNGVHVEPQTTTCPFARDVATWVRNGYGYFSAYSATTRQSYATVCRYASPGAAWRYSCDTGRGGHVTVHVY